jgi:hypothetical protein
MNKFYAPTKYSKPRAMFGKAKKLVGKVGRLTGAGLALTGAAYVAGASLAEDIKKLLNQERIEI